MTSTTNDVVLPHVHTCGSCGGKFTHRHTCPVQTTTSVPVYIGSSGGPDV